MDRIRKALHKNPRDLLLFDLVTQTGLVMKALLDQISPYLHLLMREMAVDESLWTFEAHESMLSAIKNRDPQQAASFVWSDLNMGAEIIRSMI